MTQSSKSYAYLYLGLRPLPNPERRFADADGKPKRLMGKFNEAKMSKKLKKSFREDNVASGGKTTMEQTAYKQLKNTNQDSTSHSM